MPLSAESIRSLHPYDLRVLFSLERLMKRYRWVPLEDLACDTRLSAGETRYRLGRLMDRGMVRYEKVPYDGYTLVFGGYNALALHAASERGAVQALGEFVGEGKESVVYRGLGLAEVALKFTSFEYFWLAALGLSATVMIASTNPLKAGLALLVGLFFSTVGLDITLGYPRFTLGTTELLNGVDFIPAMIGLFGVSEILRNMGSSHLQYPITAVKAEKIFSGVAKAKLLGLPAKTESPELELTADATQLVFPVKVGGDAPPGQHANVFCQVQIPQGDAWMVHNMPPTQLRIDKPLPDKEAPP